VSIPADLFVVKQNVVVCRDCRSMIFNPVMGHYVSSLPGITASSSPSVILNDRWGDDDWKCWATGLCWTTDASVRVLPIAGFPAR